VGVISSRTAEEALRCCWATRGDSVANERSAAVRFARRAVMRFPSGGSGWSKVAPGGGVVERWTAQSRSRRPSRDEGESSPARMASRRCGNVGNVRSRGENFGLLRARSPRRIVCPRSSADHLDRERRDQSRVSSTLQQRRGVPCRRLIRDSAGPAALALVNWIAASHLGMDDGAPKAHPHTQR
jgi:hypothetical protein